MTTTSSTDVLAATRDSLHRVAEHVLAAALKRATGEITLRVAPEGFSTPPLPDGRVIAVEGTELVVHRPSGVRRAPLRTLAQASGDVALQAGFPWTRHPPATPFEPHAELVVDPVAAAALAGWFALGQEALSAWRTRLAAERPTEPQLFPEHFDLGSTAAGVNYGFSPGDAEIPVPYAYVGPHESPARDEFWNTSFGAARTWREITSVAHALDFFAAAYVRVARVTPRAGAGQ